MMLNSFILSTTIHSEAFQWIHHEDKEEEQRFVCLERRLMPNVDFETPSKRWDSTRIIIKS
jgi:hypothetical protein